MNFDLTDDQQQMLDALDRFAHHAEQWPTHGAHWLPGDSVERELEENGFYDLYRESGTAIDAVLLVEKIAQFPQAIEIAASAFVAPVLTEEKLPRPIALASGPPGQPVRFLDRARTLIVDDGATVKVIAVDGLEVKPIESIFGYSFGRADSYVPDHARLLPVDVECFRARWRLGLAAEIAGAAAAALAKTVVYVKDRQQFGRAIGSFQAVQHRLAECAVAVRSTRLLALKAAHSGTEADANRAAAFAQQMAGRVCYDVHQFHGAIGLTLEYPLHYWTQRLKALQGELGGAPAAAAASHLERSGAAAMSV